MANEDNSVLSSKRAKFLKEEDRLSSLPDFMLLHILSFLELKDMARTGVLSRRWQFLWLDSSELNFNDGNKEIEKIRSFVERVGKILVICSGTHLKKFRVSFNYKNCYASSVNLWVQFLVKNKVKDVALDLDSSNYKDSYKLTEMMCSNSSLTNLSLLNCTLVPPPGNIKWKSLTSLSMGKVELSNSVMETILSGCPVLESLKLIECRGARILHINTRSLKELVIENWRYSSPQSLLEIIAPYVHRLSITSNIVGFSRHIFQLIDVSSLVRVNLDLNNYCVFSRDSEANFENALNYMKALFTCIQHVEELELGSWFIEVLPELELKGWKLPQFSCKCLTLETFRHKRSIPGILSMLESSPNLETFVINGNCPRDKARDTNGPLASHSYLEKGDLSCDLLQLKAVKFAHFRQPHPAGERVMLKLVQVLLQRAKVLEKMVIDVKDVMGQVQPRITEALLSYPRSSPKALVLLS